MIFCISSVLYYDIFFLLLLVLVFFLHPLMMDCFLLVEYHVLCTYTNDLLLILSVHLQALMCVIVYDPSFSTPWAVPCTKKLKYLNVILFRVLSREPWLRYFLYQATNFKCGVVSFFQTV